MILAIDCGSTNHKVALFDRALSRKAVCAAPVAYTVRDANRVEFDAEKIWQETGLLIRQACASAKITPSKITMIALASQAQTFTVLDAAGRPVLPFVSWADKRAVDESAQLDRLLGRGFHRHCSFPAPIPQLQLSKLLWVRQHHPFWLTPDAMIVSIPGFLAFRLGGLHVTDANLAAMSGLYSCAENDWWPAALETCDLRREQIGELVPVGQAVPARHACPELGLSPELRIVFAGNDQTAGAYANGGRSGQLILTLGTALNVYCYAGETPGPYQPQGCWGPYPGGGFYELATRDEGCAALDWALGKVMPNDEAGFMKRAESAAAGAALFYPQCMYGGAAWIGPDDLAIRARAVLEGICFSARELIEVDLKLKLIGNPVAVIGGGGKSRLWLDILANVLNCPVHRGKSDVLLGAAMMALPDITPPVCGAEAVAVPDPRMVAQYRKVYRAWRERGPLASS